MYLCRGAPSAVLLYTQTIRGTDVRSSHGLINYTDTKAFVGFSEKIDLQESFRYEFAILADESVFICGQGVAQETQIAAKSLG